jgi:hypothetical protein
LTLLPAHHISLKELCCLQSLTLFSFLSTQTTSIAHWGTFPNCRPLAGVLCHKDPERSDNCHRYYGFRSHRL